MPDTFAKRSPTIGELLLGREKRITAPVFSQMDRMFIPFCPIMHPTVDSGNRRAIVNCGTLSRCGTRLVDSDPPLGSSALSLVYVLDFCILCSILSK